MSDFIRLIGRIAFGSIFWTIGNLIGEMADSRLIPWVGFIFMGYFILDASIKYLFEIDCDYNY